MLVPTVAEEPQGVSRPDEVLASYYRTATYSQLTHAAIDDYYFGAAIKNVNEAKGYSLTYYSKSMAPLLDEVIGENDACACSPLPALESTDSEARDHYLRLQMSRCLWTEVDGTEQ